MRFFRTGILVLVVMLAGAAVGFAQTFDTHDIVFDLSGFGVIDLSDATDITLTVSPPTNPGDPPTGNSNNSKRLFYTVLTDTTYSINAAITGGGSAPSGTHVELDVDDFGATSGGAAATYTLDAVAGDIITGIASTASGRVAVANAPRLTYTLVVDTPASLDTTDDATSLTVTLTITTP